MEDKKKHSYEERNKDTGRADGREGDLAVKEGATK